MRRSHDQRIAEPRTYRTMRTSVEAALAVIAAAVLTLASLYIPATVRLVYPGSEDCTLGCDFVAAGWPLPYLVDGHGLSPQGSVWLIGGLTGEDIFLPSRMA